MKSYKTKLLIIFIVIIFIIYGIYHIFFNENNKKMAGNETVKKEKEIVNDLRMGVINFDTFNPIVSQNRDIQSITKLILEPLFSLTEDFRVIPCLAKEWSTINSKNYLIKLDNKVKWQDGKKLTAEDVIFTIDMIKQQKQSIYYTNVSNIQETKKIDETTIKIILEKEDPYFEYNLIFPILSKTNSKVLQQNGDNNIMVGTGMYYIEEKKEDKILLKANDDWWKQEKIQMDTIEVNLYRTMEEEIEDFKKEKLDLIVSSNTHIEDYLEGNAYYKQEFINRNYSYIGINQKNNILKNKEVRQAINMSIDREKIMQELFQNKYKVSYFPLDFGSYLYHYRNGK